MNYRNGFTLSEVLIALTIIGVIACITISSLLQSTQEQEYVSRLKKSNSILKQAYARTVAEGISPEEWGFTKQDSREMIKRILPYLNYTKVCYGSSAQCHKGVLKHKDGRLFGRNYIWGGNPAYSGVILTDGIIIGSYVQNEKCKYSTSPLEQYNNICGEYIVDINGEKGPNRYGTDIFFFVLTKTGIIPTGFPSGTSAGNWSYEFEKGCLAADSKGSGCTSWVLNNSNLDYLHCPEKIRAGKKSCR